LRERLHCEFFIVRYVPDVVKGEFINIGIVLREIGQPEGAVVRFTRDWARVRCIHAGADIELLESFEAELGSRLSAQEQRPLLPLLEDSLSNSVQLTVARACLAESVPAEIELLMGMYVEPITVTRERKASGRVFIAGAMRREFERAGVWGSMRKRIAASQYTRAGDPMRIDCGYRPNGVVRMFQAVSLDGDVEAAKVLAYTLPELAAGVLRVEAATLEMTAIIKPIRSLMGRDDEIERYRFGVEAMERAAIRVMTLTDLPRVAETARVELRI